MIRKVDPQIMAQTVRRMGMRPDGSSSFASAMNQAAHMKVGEMKKSERAAAQSIKTKSSKQSGVSADAFSYFAKASGGVAGKKGEAKKGQKAGHKPIKIDLNDRIHMSLDAKEEIKAERENEFDAFRSKNPLNMKAFCENLGLETPKPELSAQQVGKMSLADKLQMISLKTSGEKW